MAVISARFISLLLTALTAGVVLGHVMSRAGKVTLSGPLFVTVQNTLYRGWGKKIGAIEIGAFLSSLAVAFFARGRNTIFRSLLGLFALSPGHAVRVGGFHQSNQHPRTCSEF
jgi:short subunit fatty acids transporter